MGKDFNIEDLVSPSDMGLIDLASGLTDDLGGVKDIFADRNTKDVTVSFVLAIIAAVIDRLANIGIHSEDLVKFLAEQAEKDNR